MKRKVLILLFSCMLLLVGCTNTTQSKEEDLRLTNEKVTGILGNYKDLVTHVEVEIIESPTEGEKGTNRVTLDALDKYKKLPIKEQYIKMSEIYKEIESINKNGYLQIHINLSDELDESGNNIYYYNMLNGAFELMYNRTWVFAEQTVNIEKDYSILDKEDYFNNEEKIKIVAEEKRKKAVAAAEEAIKKMEEDTLKYTEQEPKVEEPTYLYKDAYNGLALETMKDINNEYGNVFISGKIVNTSSNYYNYVQVNFNIYDMEGNRLGTAISNLNGLDAGEVWKYKAIVTDGEGKFRYQIESIDAY